jgi:molecular chaperone DnaK (HSP70)
MSSFFDKAKDKATQLANQAKEKVDESQNKRKADDLLDDIGRIIYRQRTTGTVEPDDDTQIDALVAELAALAELGTDILGTKPEAPAAAPDAAPAAAAPMPAAAPAPAPMPMPMPMPEPGNG